MNIWAESLENVSENPSSYFPGWFLHCGFYCDIHKYVSNNIFGKTDFIFYYWFKTLIIYLDMHYGLSLGWDSAQSTKKSLNYFVILLHLEQSLIDFRVTFFH